MSSFSIMTCWSRWPTFLNGNCFTLKGTVMYLLGHRPSRGKSSCLACASLIRIVTSLCFCSDSLVYLRTIYLDFGCPLLSAEREFDSIMFRVKVPPQGLASTCCEFTSDLLVNPALKYSCCTDLMCKLTKIFFLNGHSMPWRMV